MTMSPQDQVLLDAAKRYIAAGIAILPLYGVKGGKCVCGKDCGPSGGKHPHAVLVPNGLKMATLDVEQVRCWIKAYPDQLNIGGVLGQLFVVLDEDQAGAILAAAITLPNGPAVKTGRGSHLWFKSNGHALLSGRIAPGIDVKTGEAYVVLPPSMHLSGKPYAWIEGHSLENLEPPELPVEIEQLILAAHRANGAGNGTTYAKTHHVVSGSIKLEGMLDHIRDLEATGGGWRAEILSLIGSLACRGAPDDAILVLCRQARWSSYTIEETDADVAKIIGDTRRSFGKPEQDEDGEEPATFTSPAVIRTISGAEFLSATFTPAECVLGPWLRVKNLVMIYGPRGEGKTYLILAIVLAIISGRKWLDWEAPQPRKVLLVDGEMPGAALQDRVRSLLKAIPAEVLAERLQIITPDAHPDGFTLNLDRPSDQVQLEGAIEWADVIVLDNLACLTGGDEDKREAWLPVQGWILRLRARGKTVLLVHHGGKGGDQRGTSSREDVLDVVVKLKRPPDYEDVQGLRVQWHFTKHRGFFGVDALPLEIRLDDLGSPLGKVWKWSVLSENALLLQVVDLLRDKMSIRDVGEVLDLSKSTVHRLKKKAKAAGLIK
jgi:hypothetical protein